jgi:hypothetical protein
MLFTFYPLGDPAYDCVPDLRNPGGNCGPVGKMQSNAGTAQQFIQVL